MNTRPAWGLLAIGALIVIALLVSPFWLDPLSDYLEEEQEIRPFPDAFYTDLSAEEQDIYLELYADEPQQAQAFVEARLEEPVMIDELPPDYSELLLTGTFSGLGAIYAVHGNVFVYRLADGGTAVRLEEFDTVNGPGLQLLFSREPAPTTEEELGQTALNMEEVPRWGLRGNRGNQNYVVEGVPAFNVDNYDGGSLVLYSTEYHTVFGFATLQRPPQ